MSRRLRALMAALCALPLALIAAPFAHAADPTILTSGFYVDPDSSAKRWVAANPGDGRTPAINASIANTPTARWFGSWSGAIDTATGAQMLLWIKVPGESDGDCGVGAGSTAGQFLPEAAYKMIYGY